MLVYTAISLGICGGKFPYMQKYFFAYMKEKTKCSGEGGRMSWCISELRVQGSENEMR